MKRFLNFLAKIGLFIRFVLWLVLILFISFCLKLTGQFTASNLEDFKWISNEFNIDYTELAREKLSFRFIRFVSVHFLKAMIDCMPECSDEANGLLDILGVQRND